MLALKDVSQLGFGLMRLPKVDDNFDVTQINAMVDKYIEAGFNYFDTAYTYPGSEKITKEVLINRYNRESFMLASKMFIPAGTVLDEKQKEEYLNEQFERTGTNYFDFYLIHNIASEEIYNSHIKSKTFDFFRNKKEEGKIRHLGFSFHGTPELFKRVINEQKDLDFVQIQLNYADWDSNMIYSHELYEIARENNIPIIVMEPLKGGSLVNINEEINDIFAKLNVSPLEMAFKFIYSLKGIAAILSGMSSTAQVEENICVFKNLKPLTKQEKEAIKKATQILYNSNQIACTDCKYCLKGCPKHIDIPKIFKFTNSIRRTSKDRITALFYSQIPKDRNAAACIGCKKCERVCPQHLKIVELLKESVLDLEQ